MNVIPELDLWKEKVFQNCSPVCSIQGTEKNEYVDLVCSEYRCLTLYGGEGTILKDKLEELSKNGEQWVRNVMTVCENEHTTAMVCFANADDAIQFVNWFITLYWAKGTGSLTIKQYCE